MATQDEDDDNIVEVNSIASSEAEMELSSSDEDNSDDEDSEESNERIKLFNQSKGSSKMIEQSNLVVTVVITPREERMTRSIASLEELSRILSVRSELIDNGSVHFSTMKSTDPCELAVHELLIGKCPLILRRVIKISEQKKYVEDWRMSEIAIPDFDIPEKRRAMEHM